MIHRTFLEQKVDDDVHNVVPGFPVTPVTPVTPTSFSARMKGRSKERG